MSLSSDVPAAPTDVRAFALMESGSESGFSLIQDF